MSQQLFFCQVCKEKLATKKLSILVCPEHYDAGYGQMLQLLIKLRKDYEEEQQQEQEETPPAVIEPQPQETLPPAGSPQVEKSIDQHFHDLVNKARQEQGVQPLRYDEALEAVAYLHSKDMDTRRYFSHTSPEGEDVGDRYRKSGYTGCRAWGENILYFTDRNMVSRSNQYLAEKMFNQWWNSSGHRRNMLSSNFNTEGVGIYIRNGRLTATQNFCRK